MAAWPASLPQRALLSGYAESADSNVIRSDMEFGPAKLRRRYTAEVRVYQINLALTTAQVATLDTFYDSTLGAVDAFDWVDQRTLAAAVFRFRSRPEYRPLGGGFWGASFALEKLP